MKEHLLLLFIALVGFTGLLTIHQDVSARQDDLIPYAGIQQPLPTLATLNEKVQRASLLNIDPESIWPIVHLEITNFEANADYYLDYGSGSRERITSADHSFQVDHDGMMIIRLIQDGILIDAMELQLPYTKEVTGRLVSF